ncbi:MAG: glycosyltransferase family 2 protein [Acidobacteriota bacterium]
MGNGALPITVCMLTHNEEDRLPASLGAVRSHVERILVLDAESEDRTREIARQHGAEVVARPWNGYFDARRHVLSLATSPWVLMIDADEVVDASLWAEIVARGFPGGAADGFQMRRRTVYLGRRLRRAWQPDWKTVLFRREKGRIEERSVHESVTVDGNTVRLRSEILHYSYRSIDDHYRRMIVYAELAAADLHLGGKRAGWLDLVLRPAWSWFQHLILRGGLVDGTRGWMVAKSAAISTYLRYAALYELQQPGGRNGRRGRRRFGGRS